MKLFLVSVCLFGAVACACAQIFGRGEPTRAGHGQMPQQNSAEARRSQELVGRCQRNEMATDTDMAEFSQQKKPSSITGKCLHACLMESIGLIVDGKFSAQFMSQNAQGHAELLKIVKEISEECETVTDPDRCELASKIMECTEEGFQKRQNELRKFMPRQQFNHQ